MMNLIWVVKGFWGMSTNARWGKGKVFSVLKEGVWIGVLFRARTC
ncbi:hypothetical protein SAMN05421766_101698 [Zobellia uliginosa]|uniref:Uncharacterized protein n=1 Tax=Zobellia uliginosa TaxID=143224 RepID=A0ABY1KJD7_9FLAO|nr:hypothetical protein SAMN05421766_101698 [Zobellia uliginosa]